MVRSSTALLALALAGCSGPTLGSAEHTVNEFYADDQLRAETLTACQADTSAGVDKNMKKPACKNALAAERAHQFGTRPE